MSVKNAFSGRGGGQVVSVFVFYYDDPSSNPVKAYSLFLENLCLKRKKIYKKRPDWPIFKNKFLNCWAQGFFKKECISAAKRSPSHTLSGVECCIAFLYHT